MKEHPEDFIVHLPPVGSATKDAEIESLKAERSQLRQQLEQAEANNKALRRFLRWYLYLEEGGTDLSRDMLSRQ